MRLILASNSAARAALLAAAGVAFETRPPGVDEESLKFGLLAEGLKGRDLADALAEFKALKLSAREPTALVLGCDQVLQRDDGVMLDKPTSREDAREQLAGLRGRSHILLSAAVVAEGGRGVWRHVETAKMRMRDFSDAFLDAYVTEEYPEVAGCVGGYKIEGRGAQLFSRIEGSQFAVMGLPLLALLDYLRVRGVIPS